MEQVDLSRSEGHTEGNRDGRWDIVRQERGVYDILGGPIAVIGGKATDEQIEFVVGTRRDDGHHGTKMTTANAYLIADAPAIRAELIRARERIAQLEAAAAWRPISEAPRDGLVLIAVGDLVGEGFFMDDPSRNHWGLTGWFFLEDNVLCDKPSFPTHFRPLPAAPTTPIAEGGE